MKSQTRAPPSEVPTRLPAVCHPDARPRSDSGTVTAMSASTADALVAAAACATKRTPVYTQSSDTGPRCSCGLGGMSAVAASMSAVRATETKNQLRRRGPASSAGDQKNLMTCGKSAIPDAVPMSVMSTPRARSSKGMAVCPKPTASPNGRVRIAQ